MQAKQDDQGDECGGEETEPEKVHRRMMAIGPVQGAETQRLAALDEPRQIPSSFADQIGPDVDPTVHPPPDHAAAWAASSMARWATWSSA